MTLLDKCKRCNKVDIRTCDAVVSHEVLTGLDQVLTFWAKLLWIFMNSEVKEMSSALCEVSVTCSTSHSVQIKSLCSVDLCQVCVWFGREWECGVRACEGDEMCVSAAKELELATLRFKWRFHVMIKKHNMLKMMKHHKCKKCMKHRNEADVAGRRDGRMDRPSDLMVKKTLIYLIVTFVDSHTLHSCFPCTE